MKLMPLLGTPGGRMRLLRGGYWFFSLLYWELLIQFSVFGGLSSTFGYLLGFTLVCGCVLTMLTSFIPPTYRVRVMLGISIVLIVLYGSEMVYNFVFGTLYSVSQMGLGGDAVTAFWREVLSTIFGHLLWIIALLLPLLVLMKLRVFAKKKYLFTQKQGRIYLVVAGTAIYLLMLLCLRISGVGYYSNYYYYATDQLVTNQSASRFGLMTTLRLEVFGSELKDKASDATEYLATNELEMEESSVVETSVEEENVTEYNVLEIDFDALSELTDDETILALNEYCSSLTGTNKNEYTGMLADYNLIVICAESFATGAIDPEITPTLYKLSTEGIIFNNYYNGFPNTTTDGEYTLCMGLYPDSSREKSASSMYASRSLYLPYTLGNLFSEQRSITSYGYHNYVGSYYGRDESHPNMGYSMKFMNDGMSFSYDWPSSDLEMMEQSVGDYVNSGTQFHAYYMTFSGHYEYDVSTNNIARDNYYLVEDLDYSEEVKCYLACNIELDRALEYLMDQLEAAGVADKTAIVLAGDHFPYGLTNDQYSELVGYEVDGISKFKSTLIFWVGGLEENIVVDEYCCNVDILPTILNLWGFEYDSRLLAGTDVFSDGVHIAMQVDKSFMTDKVWLNTYNGEIVYLVDESELPAGYVDSMIQLVENKFKMSSDILNSAYYNFVFGKNEATADTETWWE